VAVVSVIIPTRNRAGYLVEAVESAKRAGDDVEIVVVDDASDDDTPSVCRTLSGIRAVRLDTNVGLARARNIGIARSTGRYLAFLDDDDLRLPASLDMQVDILSRNNEAAFVYGQVDIADRSTGALIGETRPARCVTGDIFWELLAGNFIYVPSVLVARQRFEAIGLFATDVPGTEDWDAWIRLAAHGVVEALHAPVAVYRDFSRGSAQMSANRPKMCMSSASTLRKALKSPRALSAPSERRHKVHAAYMNFLWDELVREGQAAMSEGKTRYAVRNFTTAMRLNPGRAARLGAVLGILQHMTRSPGTKLR
jgi:hypothetical protein